MNPKFVNIGIDHGTSNSSIAWMTPDGPELASFGKDRAGNPLYSIPSAVFFAEDGAAHVGEAGRQAMLMRGHGIGHSKYKIRLGYNDRFAIPGGKSVTAPEIGGRILGTLLSRFREQTGIEETLAAVITVPATFPDFSCTATQECGRRAGLQFCPTLAEPRAAALAYGFGQRTDRAQWLVFDLGAGTLDISVVAANAGEIEVLSGSDGDVYLGGSKWDKVLLQYLLGPRTKEADHDSILKEYRSIRSGYDGGLRRRAPELADLTAGSDKMLWDQLLLIAEQAKIGLSSQESVVVDFDRALADKVKSSQSQLVVELTRRELEALIDKDISSAVERCRHCLERNHLKPADVERIVLVGGPTKTPRVRARLQEALGITADITVDPMLAVAQGAAIFAATVELPKSLIVIPVSDPTGMALELAYEASSPIAQPRLTGMLANAGQRGVGATVTVDRKDGAWSSGELALDKDGGFEIQLELRSGGQPLLSEFTTTVRAATGRILATREEPAIWHPYPVGKDTLPNDLLIGTARGHASILMAQGIVLPAEVTDDKFVTSAELKAGTKGAALAIPVLEGVPNHFGHVQLFADCNLPIGELLIGADKVDQSVSQGSSVEITLKRSVDREITVTAFLPQLGVDYSATFLSSAPNPDLQALSYRIEKFEKDLSMIRDIGATGLVAEILKKLEEQAVVVSLKRSIADAQAGDTHAGGRAYLGVLQLAATLHEIYGIQQLPRMKYIIRKLRLGANQDMQSNLDRIEKQLTEAENLASPELYQAIEKELNDLLARSRIAPVLALFEVYQLFPDKFRGSESQLAAFKEMQEFLSGDAASKISHPQEFTAADISSAEQLRDRVLSLWRDEIKGWVANAPPEKTEEIRVLLGRR